MKPIVIRLKKKNLIIFKALMYFVTLYLVIDIISIFFTGEVHTRQFKYVQGESIGFYVVIFKIVVFAAVSFWFATGGSKVIDDDEIKIEERKDPGK